MKASPTLLLCALVALCLLGKLQANSVETSTDDKEDLDLTEEVNRVPGLCWLCKGLINIGKRRLERPSTKVTVTDRLTKACDYFGFLKSTCTKLVKADVEILWEELPNIDIATMFCVYVGACKSEAFDEDMEFDLGLELDEFLKGLNQKSACRLGAV